MTNTIQTTPVVQHAASKPDSEQPRAATDPGGVTLGTCALMCGFTLALSLAIVSLAPQIALKYGFTLPGAAPAPQAAKVVYLDFERLLLAGIEQSKGMEQSDLSAITKEADKFQADIGVLLQKYATEGYVVVNSKAVIIGAKAQDITPAFIKGLGLSPKN